MRTGTGGIFNREHFEPSGSMLDSIASARLVEFELSANHTAVVITERCDGHFSAELLPADMDMLIAELKAIRKQMKTES
jgi:hypothetical protein